MPCRQRPAGGFVAVVTKQIEACLLYTSNGITSEEHIDAAYPGHTLWSVAIGMDATRTGRTLVLNQAGTIQFGERSGEMTDRVQAVADYLDECGKMCIRDRPRRSPPVPPAHLRSGTSGGLRSCPDRS